jgi:hypothetical protein
MDHLEKQVLNLMRVHGKVSPALIMNKMKVSSDVAEDLFCKSLFHQAKNWFYMRNFGMDTEEFMKGDFLESPKEIMQPR